MKVVGLDLSLTSSGVASSEGVCYRITTQSKSPLKDRLRLIADAVAEEVEGAVVLMEEVPTHAAFSITPLAKVHGAVLYASNPDRIGMVTPPQLKKYATGKGNANKDAVLAEAIRRFGFEGSSNDEADAFILMHMGLDLMGEAVVQVPQVNRSVLEGLTWT